MEMVRFESVDYMVVVEDTIRYLTEFLHTLKRKGIPPHTLFLKVGAPIIFLRNLKLSNGTRLQIESLHEYVIEVTIFTVQVEGLYSMLYYDPFI